MNPSFPRLTGVELRKMVDTRAGFWLQLIVAGVTLAAIVIVCIIADADEVSFRDLLAHRRSRPRRSCCRSSASCSSARSGRSAPR